MIYGAGNKSRLRKPSCREDSETGVKKKWKGGITIEAEREEKREREREREREEKSGKASPWCVRFPAQRLSSQDTPLSPWSFPSPFVGTSPRPGMICALDSASIAPCGLTRPQQSPSIFSDSSNAELSAKSPTALIVYNYANSNNNGPFLISNLDPES